MMKAGSEIELKHPPTDGISSLRFSPHNDTQLLSTSWDGQLYLHDVRENRQMAAFPLNGAPLLDCAHLKDPAQAVAGGLSKDVTFVDLSTARTRSLGKHGEAVKSLWVEQSSNRVISGGWDAHLAVWDTRQAECVQRVQLPGKVYTMDGSQGGCLVVGMSDRHVWIFDHRNLAEPLQRRESSLKYQTRCIRCFPDGDAYACSSIEGRVAIDLIDPTAQDQKYAFKCHRQPSPTQADRETVFPVNALAIHPTYGTFATGGGDGLVMLWDRQNRRRLKQLPKYPTSVSALAFNRDGQALAIAASYGYEEGEKDHLPDSIFIRFVEDVEVRPKTY